MKAKLAAVFCSCECLSPSIRQGNGRSVGCSIPQSEGELRVTAVLFLFLGNSWEYLNKSIITEEWLLGSAEVSFLFFLSPHFPPLSLWASLPSFHPWQ